MRHGLKSHVILDRVNVSDTKIELFQGRLNHTYFATNVASPRLWPARPPRRRVEPFMPAGNAVEKFDERVYSPNSFLHYFPSTTNTCRQYIQVFYKDIPTAMQLRGGRGARATPTACTSSRSPPPFCGNPRSRGGVIHTS